MQRIRSGVIVSEIGGANLKRLAPFVLLHVAAREAAAGGE
jgi:hypothetical protein